MSVDAARNFIEKLYNDEKKFDEFKNIKSTKQRRQFAKDIGFDFDQEEFEAVFDITDQYSFMSQVLKTKLGWHKSMTKYIYG